MIFGWDLIVDQQLSILECDDPENIMFEFYLQKGINPKMNYF